MVFPLADPAPCCRSRPAVAARPKFRYCVHLSELYAKVELYQPVPAAKFRFCVHLSKLYANAELLHALLSAKFRSCVHLDELYAKAELRAHGPGPTCPKLRTVRRGVRKRGHLRP